MLTISRPLNSAQAQSYHKMEFTSEAQTYYAQGDSVQGEWQGQLADTFGLSGAVDAGDFARLADGQNPQTGEQMVKHRTGQEYTAEDGSVTKPAEHRAGWDATFSAPKSVSLTALVGGDEMVREAHRAAVHEALSELERFTQARLGGNTPAETTGRLIAAKFEHDTARPVDGYAAPQLHTHAVIFNVTTREDGTTRALDARSLFESQNYATAVYQSSLTYRLRKLGYEIEPGRSGAPEIRGYTQEYLDASSPRSQQIKAQMEKAGYEGPEAAQIAAHATRDHKLTLSSAEVLAAHKAMAAEYGDQPAQVVYAAQQRSQSERIVQPDSKHAREAVTYAKEHSFEREAVVDERLVLRDAIRRAMGAATSQQIRQEFESRRQAGEFCAVDGPKYNSARSFTTPETIAHERANIQHVQFGRNQVAPILSAEHAEAHANGWELLNSSQRRVIEEVLNSTDRIHGLQGLAGTGKTTALAAIREGAERGGYAVEGFAPTSKAAGQLREAGIDSNTLQSFLAAKPQPEGTRHLYMLDESSLASSRQMRQFLDRIGPEDHVLVIGDIRQHQSVEAGRAFQQMQEAGMQTSQLDKIMRQRDPELLKAVEHLAHGRTETGIALLREQGRVTEITDPANRIRAIARDYAAQPENTIIVSPDNRSRQQINEAVRVELRERGMLGNDAVRLLTLTGRGDMTGADRAWAARYTPGDVLQYTTGSRTEGIERGSYATTRSIDARANVLTVETEAGEKVSYDPRRLRGVNVFRETEREFAAGDRIQFTSGNKELGVRNRELGTVVSAAPDQITVRIDGKDKRVVSFDPAKMRQIDHGYAVTSHSSQGLTAERVLANFDTDGARSLINSRLGYVAISRASMDARIYTNDAEGLGGRLATEVTKSAALGSQEHRSTTRIQSHEFAGTEHRLAAVALDYVSQADRAVVVAKSSAERQEITGLIRDELHRTGQLASEESVVPVLRERHLHNSRSAAHYGTGDVIQFRTGSVEHGIPDRSQVTVVETDRADNRLIVQRDNGDRVAYDPAELKAQTREARVYRPDELELSKGDRIRFTQADRDNGIRNGSFATIDRIEDNGSITVKLDNGSKVELRPEHARHIEHGYAVEHTARLAVDRILLTGEHIDPAAAAAVSPHLRELHLYTAHQEPVQQVHAQPAVAEKAHGVPGHAIGLEDHHHSQAHGWGIDF